MSLSTSDIGPGAAVKGAPPMAPNPNPGPTPGDASTSPVSKLQAASMPLTMLHHFTCRDCGMINEVYDNGVDSIHKACRRCGLMHDGLTDEEQADYNVKLEAGEKIPIQPGTGLPRGPVMFNNDIKRTPQGGPVDMTPKPLDDYRQPAQADAAAAGSAAAPRSDADNASLAAKLKEYNAAKDDKTKPSGKSK